MYVTLKGMAELVRGAVHRPTVGKATVILTLLPLFIVFSLVNAIGFGLDHVFFGGFRKRRVDRPVFLFATPRSGTTLAHRLIAMDATFTTVKLYQTIFPSITTSKLFDLTTKLVQTPFGLPLRWVFNFANAPLERRWQGVHALGLDKPEEDEATFILSGTSPATALLVPEIELIPTQMDLDAASPEIQRRVLRSYRRLLQRHVHYSGGRRFLNKNVFFGSRLKGVAREFDDAIFVYLVRNPLEAVPSFLNMFYVAWQAHSPTIAPDGPEMQKFTEYAYAQYRYAMKCKLELPDREFIVIRYEDLIADPTATILDLYKQLRMPVSPEFRASLDDEMEAHRSYTSTHEYTLEKFGLTEARVREELSDVFARYGYNDQSHHSSLAAE